jgi:hypothetical protein
MRVLSYLLVASVFFSRCKGKPEAILKFNYTSRMMKVDSGVSQNLSHAQITAVMLIEENWTSSCTRQRFDSLKTLLTSAEIKDLEIFVANVRADKNYAYVGEEKKGTSKFEARVFESILAKGKSCD